MNYYLAIDIGASSGRHIIGYKEGEEIITKELYRFKNGVLKKGRYLYWDTDALFSEIKKGLKIAFLEYGSDIRSLAIDTWGVDYVLFEEDNEILPCFAYRDLRTEEAIDKVHSIVPFSKLYAKTGIQFQSFNTIYQLFHDKMTGKIDKATDFLMMPEYLSYRLTGVKRKEYTEASTTGLVNAQTGEFDLDIIRELGLPKRLFCKLSQPGTEVGYLTEDVQKEVGGNTRVVLCASHDTASAVEGIPMEDNQVFISSGTWSLLGVKLSSAITDDTSCKTNYSNEGGVGYIRYLKNIPGMWVVNNLKAQLCPDLTFEEIVNQAENSSFEGVVDVNSPIFLSPESMTGAFDGFFSFENKPKSIGDYFKCALKSLALGYKFALEELSLNTGKKYEKLYIVGGGAKNKYLNRLTEELCKVKVIALPIEATSLGNIKVQINADNA